MAKNLKQTVMKCIPRIPSLNNLCIRMHTNYFARYVIFLNMAVPACVIIWNIAETVRQNAFIKSDEELHVLMCVIPVCMLPDKIFCVISICNLLFISTKASMLRCMSDKLKSITLSVLSYPQAKQMWSKQLSDEIIICIHMRTTNPWKLNILPRLVWIAIIFHTGCHNKWCLCMFLLL